MKTKSRFTTWCILLLTSSLLAQQPCEIKKAEVDTMWLQQTAQKCVLSADTTKVMQEDIIYLLKKIQKNQERQQRAFTAPN